MLGLSRKLRVFAWAEPVDMRKSFWTLSALVQTLGRDVADGDVFLFVGRGRRRAKALWFDGTGLVLLCKILEQGRFAPVWERAKSGVAELSMSELMVFLEGCTIVGKAPIVARTYDAEKS
jgi:transposase